MVFIPDVEIHFGDSINKGVWKHSLLSVTATQFQPLMLPGCNREQDLASCHCYPPHALQLDILTASLFIPVFGFNF